MQHGTGREVVTEAIENALAVLVREMKYADVQAALSDALSILHTDPTTFDTPGVYGPDYAFPTKNYPKVVKYLGPTGSIRDTRPEGLGRSPWATCGHGACLGETTCRQEGR